MERSFLGVAITALENTERSAVPAGDDTMRVVVERADGSKCERCWKYSTQIGVDPDYPTVCDSCAAALKEMVAHGETLG